MQNKERKIERAKERKKERKKTICTNEVIWEQNIKYKSKVQKLLIMDYLK